MEEVSRSLHKSIRAYESVTHVGFKSILLPTIKLQMPSNFV